MAKIQVKIESILGGRGSLSDFGQIGQFKDSLAIDPDRSALGNGLRSSGLLVPTPSISLGTFSGSGIDDEILWMNTTPKDDDVYVYDRAGKVYTVRLSSYLISDLNAGIALTASTGNGATYYDNYQYFCKNTNVCRYGPLSGARTYNQAYWGTTLSMTALSNGVTYPALRTGTTRYPNHVMHVHLDDKLYICDVPSSGAKNNSGVVHYIRTRRDTVEGDTNNGSTWNALDLGFGIFPTALASFGTDLAIAAYEGDTSSGNTRGKRAKVFFWDTTSSSFNKEVELPDPFCSALKNVNGTLYTFSGNPGDLGVRICKFVGGYTFEEVAYLEDSQMPPQGAVDHLMSRILFGGFSSSMSNFGSLYALGSRIGKISTGIFNIMRTSTEASNGVTVTSVLVPENTDINNPTYLIGWRDGGGTSEFGIDRNARTYRASEFKSSVFRIGKEFEVTKIKIPLAQAIAANMTLAVKILVDNESTTTTVATINNTNFSESERTITLHPSVFGKHDFILQLSWSGSALLTVGLPIEIELDTIDD